MKRLMFVVIAGSFLLMTSAGCSSNTVELKKDSTVTYDKSKDGAPTSVGGGAGIGKGVGKKDFDSPPKK